MTSPHPAPEAWAHWWNELDALAVLLKQSKGGLVSASPTREQAKLVVQYYFRQVRPHLIDLSIDAGDLEQLDRISQHLLKLASKRSRRSTYRTRMRELDNLRGEIETAIEIRATGGGAHSAGRLTTATEAAILATLDQIVPSTALSYQQVLQDLAEPQRVSYRGTAAELREVLRELLDHLAPDDEVLKAVKLEKDRRGPTMKQKATFILKARGVGETARKTPVDAVGAIEDSVSSLARSVYTRGSVSTHVVTTRNEVLTIKAYADAVLADLLQIHK
jgi:predicted ABC-type transport system involved in lysophospholipase L1 biosynthesis ATPase subunit